MRNLRLKHLLLVLSVLVAAGVAAWLFLTAAFPDSGSEDSPLPPSASPSPVPIPTVRFTDITKAAGMNFMHTNGAFDKKLLPETPAR